MSTLKVNKIEHTGTTDGGIEIDNTGHVQIDGLQLPTAGPLSNRNLIINGAMQIAQRGTQVTGVTTSAYNSVDRFRDHIGSLGTWTSEQSTDAPDGFSNSHRLLCTTANAAPGASAFAAVLYHIEGFDCQRLLDTGTTTHPMRLSFWVKAIAAAETFPKTASIELIQTDNSSKLFSASYTIQASDTWERIVIPIPVDTAAAFSDDNGSGLQITWWMNSGSQFTGGAHSAGWVALDNTARNATNLGVGGTVNDEFSFTGVQLEVGSAVTPFEHRSYGDELQRCQRYCFVPRNPGHNSQVGWLNANMWGPTTPIGILQFPTSMRTAPSVLITDVTGIQALAGGSNFALSSLSVQLGSEHCIEIVAGSSNSFTQGQGGWLRMQDTDDDATPIFSAEL